MHEFYVGYLCDNIGLVLACLPSGTTANLIFAHQAFIVYNHKPSWSTEILVNKVMKVSYGATTYVHVEMLRAMHPHCSCYNSMTEFLRPQVDCTLCDTDGYVHVLYIDNECLMSP